MTALNFAFAYKVTIKNPDLPFMCYKVDLSFFDHSEVIVRLQVPTL